VPESPTIPLTSTPHFGQCLLSSSSSIFYVVMKRNLTQMCGANRILSEQVWIWWNSIGKGRRDVDDEQITGHQNTSTGDEITVRANVILKGKCYIKLIDMDRRMDVSVGAAPITDRGHLDHNSFSVQWLSKVSQHVDGNSPCHAFDALRQSRTTDLAGRC